MMQPETDNKKKLKAWSKKVSNSARGNYAQNVGAVVVRYSDGCQTLLSDNDFFYMLQKRKNDPFWKTVVYVRNYVPTVKLQQQTIVDVAYDHGNISLTQKRLYTVPCTREPIC